MKADTGMVSACRSCGRTDAEFEVVSVHRTAQGTVSYIRCSCGGLQVLSRSRLDGSERVVTGPAPAPSEVAGSSVA